MNANQFPTELARKTEQLRRYMEREAPKRAGQIAKRFVDGNFRAQGWQGKTFERWQKNAANRTILIRKGRLRRGTKTEVTPYQVRVYNDVPYAAAHNKGFKGTVQIPEHTRNRYTATRVGTGRFNKSGNERMRTVHQVTGSSQVKAHQRQMNIPKRQFMPNSATDSPVFNAAVRREIVRTLKTIFQ